jgi:hypothetical protein
VEQVEYEHYRDWWNREQVEEFMTSPDQTEGGGQVLLREGQIGKRLGIGCGQEKGRRQAKQLECWGQEGGKPRKQRRCPSKQLRLLKGKILKCPVFYHIWLNAAVCVLEKFALCNFPFRKLLSHLYM